MSTLLSKLSTVACIAAMFGVVSSTAILAGAQAQPAGHHAAHAAKKHHRHHRRHHRRHRTSHHGIPQHNGGDHDSDNNGGPTDGDGNV